MGQKLQVHTLPCVNTQPSLSANDLDTQYAIVQFDMGGIVMKIIVSKTAYERRVGRSPIPTNKLDVGQHLGLVVESNLPQTAS